MRAEARVSALHTGTGDVAQVVQTHALLRNPRKGNPDLRVATVINHTGRAKSADRDTREVLEELGVAVTKTEIPDLVRYSTAKGQRRLCLDGVCSTAKSPRRGEGKRGGIRPKQ